MSLPKPLKCVVVGDRGAGKTSLLSVHTDGLLPHPYIPSVFRSAAVDGEVDGQHVRIDLWDTSTSDCYERLRPLAYPDASVFLVLYAVDEPESLVNVWETWLPEVAHFAPGVPIVLVGTKLDLRADPAVLSRLAKRGLDPVSTEQGAAMAKRIRAAAYVECSALTQLGVKGVFDAAIRAGRECPLDHWLSTCLTFVSDAPDGHKELY